MRTALGRSQKTKKHGGPKAPTVKIEGKCLLKKDNFDFFLSTEIKDVGRGFLPSSIFGEGATAPLPFDLFFCCNVELECAMYIVQSVVGRA